MLLQKILHLTCLKWCHPFAQNSLLNSSIQITLAATTTPHLKNRLVTNFPFCFCYGPLSKNVCTRYFFVKQSGLSSIIQVKGEITWNALEQVQWVHAPTDLWDITFCNRRLVLCALADFEVQSSLLCNRLHPQIQIPYACPVRSLCYNQLLSLTNICVISYAT